MHSALVIATPPIGVQDKLSFQSVLEEAGLFLTPTKGIETLAESTWLIQLQTGLPEFGRLLHLFAGSHVQYKVLFFETEPSFVTPV